MIKGISAPQQGCDGCDLRALCDAQCSSIKLAYRGLCQDKVYTLTCKYASLSDEDLNKVLVEEEKYPHAVYYKVAQGEYVKRKLRGIMLALLNK